MHSFIIMKIKKQDAQRYLPSRGAPEPIPSSPSPRPVYLWGMLLANGESVGASRERGDDGDDDTGQY